jgi:hypothetical protein
MIDVQIYGSTRLLSIQVHDGPENRYMLSLRFENHSGVPGSLVQMSGIFKCDLIMLRDFLIEMELGEHAEI